VAAGAGRRPLRSSSSTERRFAVAGGVGQAAPAVIFHRAAACGGGGVGQAASAVTLRERIAPAGILVLRGAMSLPFEGGLPVMSLVTHVAVLPTVRRADIPALCGSLSRQLRGRDCGVVICEVAQARPDMVTVEALVRLRLTARRHGWTLTVHGSGTPLTDLVALLGLTGALSQGPPDSG
jgi:hypothetical protein